MLRASCRNAYATTVVKFEMSTIDQMLKHRISCNDRLVGLVSRGRSQVEQERFKESLKVRDIDMYVYTLASSTWTSYACASPSNSNH